MTENSTMTENEKKVETDDIRISDEERAALTWKVVSLEHTLQDEWIDFRTVA